MGYMFLSRDNTIKSCYDVGVRITNEECEKILANAELFLSKINELIESLV